MLERDIVTIDKNGESIYISGFGVGYTDMYSQLLKTIPADRFNILLYHYADIIEDLEGFNVVLYLSGHTHGGQIALPFYGAIITLSKYGKKYESGKYIVGDTMMYINRGIGMEGGRAPRVRFWARPEITVFNIVPGSGVHE